MAFDIEGARKAGYSDAEIESFLAQPQETYVPSKAAMGEDVPKWGRDNPNLYAAAMTALDMSPALASLSGNPLVGIPLAGAINSVAQSAKRALHGDETTAGQAVTDAALGATVEGAGRGVAKGVAVASKVPAVRDLMNKAASGLYGSAMKFSTSPNVLTPAERASIVETGLKYKMTPDESSWLRLKDIVKANSSKVDDVIRAATDAGDTIAPADVLKAGSLGDLIARGKMVQGVAPGYADDVVNQIVNFAKQGKQSPEVMNVQKKQLQTVLAKDYGSNTLSDSASQTKKQIAAGIKSVLEERYPEIANLNSESHELLNLSDHLARSIGRVGNRDVIGLGDKILMDTVANVSQEGGKQGASTVGMLISALDRPGPKAKLAIALYKANTGKTLPLSQWRKGMKYVDTPTVRGAFDAAVLGAANQTGENQ